jgi:hypothetical protein
MDIWRWVGQVGYDLRDAGHHRLAEIIDDLPPAVCYGRHEAAEAMVPEGLALARGLDLPWVEVFLRHWLAQSRLAHRRDVSSGLAEVIDLLDFAHQESARECPQSICVTQDVCIAYGALDGPGYGEERLAAAVEAMARIDVSWPCFGCISSEQASALLDLDQPWKVIYRGGPYLMSPQTLYECVGDVPNVAFPCAALTDAATGRIALYYGAADTVTGLAFCQVDDVLAWLKENNEL